MYRSFIPFGFVFALLFLFSCSGSKQLSGVWINTEKMKGKSYRSIFLMAQTRDIQARQSVENALAAKAADKGYLAVKSIDVLTPSLSDTALPSHTAIEQAARSSNCDAVFVVTLLNKEESVRYVPGAAVYSPAPYYSWNGNFYGYYNHWTPTVSHPGYYTKEKNYFLQSNLYDLATGELMLSVQSEVFSPTSMDRFSRDYVNDLVGKMEKEGLLKK